MHGIIPIRRASHHCAMHRMNASDQSESTGIYTNAIYPRIWAPGIYAPAHRAMPPLGEGGIGGWGCQPISWV